LIAVQWRRVKEKVPQISCETPVLVQPTEWQRIGNQIDAAMIFGSVAEQ
jgi:hypothetical protein